jgi:holo-[acyl-carrier protein] synthase
MNGIGIDIVCISEFANLVNDSASVFVPNHFTDAEVQYSKSAVSQRPEIHLAARYAAKEALIKALESMHLFRPPLITKLQYTEIELAKDPHGRPYFIFHGEIEMIVKDLNIQAMVSLSHDGDYAIAQVLLVKK